LKSSMVMGVTLLLAGLVDVSAQSLAEVARKEKERRQALGETKVEAYDDRSLGGRGLSVPSPPPAAVAERSAEVGESEATEDSQEIEEEDPTQTEAYWRDRKAAIERRVSDIESQLNRPGFSSDPSNMMRRTQLEQQLEQARSDLAALQADARRQGIPPGWVR